MDGYREAPISLYDFRGPLDLEAARLPGLFGSKIVNHQRDRDVANLGILILEGERSITQQYSRIR